jgi:hypothetical protein
MVAVVSATVAASIDTVAEEARFSGSGNNVLQSPFVRRLFALLVEIHVFAGLLESKGHLRHCWLLAAARGPDRQSIRKKRLALRPGIQLCDGNAPVGSDWYSLTFCIVGENPHYTH